jgi:hypothetical protein
LRNDQHHVDIARRAFLDEIVAEAKMAMRRHDWRQTLAKSAATSAIVRLRGNVLSQIAMPGRSTPSRAEDRDGETFSSSPRLPHCLTASSCVRGQGASKIGRRL